MVSIDSFVTFAGAPPRFNVRGPAAGGAPPAPWWQPIADLLGGAGLFVAAGEGITASVGNPVDTWDDVRGGAALAQPGATSLRPLNMGSYVLFDRVDDRMLGNAKAATLNGAHTILVGFDNPEDTTLAVHTLLSASSATGTSSLGQVSLNYSNPSAPNSTRQRYYVADAASAASVQLMDLSALGAGPYNVALRRQAPGTGAEIEARRLADQSVIGVDAAAPASAFTFTGFEVGCRSVGATPTRTQFWGGRLRYVVLAPFTMSDAQLATCYAALAAGGKV